MDEKVILLSGFGGNEENLYTGFELFTNKMCLPSRDSKSMFQCGSKAKTVFIFPVKTEDM